MKKVLLFVMIFISLSIQAMPWNFRTGDEFKIPESGSMASVETTSSPTNGSSYITEIQLLSSNSVKFSFTVKKATEIATYTYYFKVGDEVVFYGHIFSIPNKSLGMYGKATHKITAVGNNYIEFTPIGE